MMNKQVLLRLLNSYGFHSYPSDLSLQLYEVNYHGESPGVTPITVVAEEISTDKRMLTVYLNNVHRIEGKYAYEQIFKILTTNKVIKKFAKHKIVFITGRYNDDIEAALHPNILIHNRTTFRQ